MTAITFDTLDASARLRATALDEDVAKAIVQVVSRTADLPDISKLATKDDIARLDKGLDQMQAFLITLFGVNIATALGTTALLYNLLK